MAGEEVGSEFLRFLRIKHKVVQRLAKEVLYYQAEVKQHEATVSRMKAENREPSDIKQQQNVLDETVLMVPDAESRLLRACAELDDYMLSNRVCAAAARGLRSGAAARPQEKQWQQQQQQEQNSEAGAAAAAGVTEAATRDRESYQQQRSGSDNAATTQREQDGNSCSSVAQQANQRSSSSSNICRTNPNQQSFSRVNARETKVDGGATREGQKLNEEIYDEVQKIFETARRIERDLPHLHVSLGAAHEVTGSGATTTEDVEEEDI